MTDERFEELLVGLLHDGYLARSSAPLVRALHYIVQTCGTDAELSLEAFCASREPFEDKGTK